MSLSTARVLIYMYVSPLREIFVRRRDPRGVMTYVLHAELVNPLHPEQSHARLGLGLEDCKVAQSSATMLG